MGGRWRSHLDEREAALADGRVACGDEHVEAALLVDVRVRVEGAHEDSDEDLMKTRGGGEGEVVGRAWKAVEGGS